MARCMNCGENVRKGAMCKCYGSKGMTKGASIKKVASDVGATAPKTKNLEVGDYTTAPKAKLDGFGRAGIQSTTPRKTETWDTVPEKGFKSVSIGNLEVGGYKRK